MLKERKIYIVPFLGFMAIIIAGWILLMMPINNNGNISISDAFFTSDVSSHNFLDPSQILLLMRMYLHFTFSWT